ncbi:MAG: tRNA (N6-isopentenyl adenosine(37)-C2)-methylthiotransferase MiaB [Selenomonadaceae bacterium]|nr:tRNA (N6-isopentenyl adenosine(37)-C2)-methylthiotransferase MiaB [Selenomonadaceae bacterium]
MYGCQMNVAEGESVRKVLTSKGYEETADIKTADLILLHTCCVRESAEEKVYGKIGEIKGIKRDNPKIIVGIMGCMAQKEGESLFKRAKHIDFVLGPGEIGKISSVIDDVKKNRNKVLGRDLEDYASLPVASGKASVFVPIMTGCNNFCSYCIVPYTRGREKSRAFDDILGDIRNVVKSGAKEITLLGQNVNSYGKDLKGRDFSDLLKAADEVEGIARLRFMTSHPKDLSDKLIDTMANGIHIAPHLHLPMQHASNRILKIMNRNYTKEHYLSLIEKIRGKMPSISVTTDLIVGFPGETEEDFAELLDFLDIVKWDAAYTFIYSKRSGTPAAKMDGQVPEDVKHERLSRLMEKENEISLQANKKYEGKIVSVLVEGESKDERIYQGRTGENKLTLFERSDENPGDIVDMRIIEAKTWLLKGERVR